MSDNIDDVAFDRWYFPFIPVLLRNRGGENKCFVNSVLQAFKACPAIRNYVFANLRGKSLLKNSPVHEVWKDPAVFAFWESFLFSELRDGKREHTMTGVEKPRFDSGFFGELYMNNSLFATLDYPWDIPVCGFGDFKIERYNEMRTVVEAIHAIDKAYHFSQKQLIVHVTPGTNAGMQLEGPVVMLSPLHQSTRDDHKYLQKDEKNSVYKTRVTFPEEHYKKCLNTALKESSDRGDFVLSDHGTVLIVYVEVSIHNDAIVFLPAGNEHAPSQEHIDNVCANLQGFRVCSMMKAKPFLHLQGKFFVLTAVVKNLSKNHFVCSTNGDLDQIWWNFDDVDLSPCNKAGNLQSTNIQHGNAITYFYQKMVVDESLDEAETLKALEEKYEMILKNNNRTRCTSTSKEDVLNKSLKPYSKVPFQIIVNKTDERSQSDSMLYDPNSMPSQLQLMDLDTEEGRTLGTSSSSSSSSSCGSSSTSSNSGSVSNSSSSSSNSCSSSKGGSSSSSSSSNTSGTSNSSSSGVGSNKKNNNKNKKAKLTVDNNNEEVRSDDLENSESDNDSNDGLEEIEDDTDDLVGKEFYMREGLGTVKGQVISCLTDEKNIFYKAYFAKDKSWDIYPKRDMLMFMLNGRNGTPLPDREQDFLLTAVRACEVRPEFQHLKHPKPLHYKFDIKWGNLKYDWMDYNHTMFTTEPMKKFVRDNLNYKSFKNHYDKEMITEWMQYRYVPSSKSREEHFKIVLGNGTTINKTMAQAVTYFGAQGVDNIKRQHSLLAEMKQKTQFFFVSSCQPIDDCSGLEKQTECLDELQLGIASEDSHYKWVQLAVDVWIRRTVLKTDGIFCFIAASLNASLFSHSRCIELFTILKSMHSHEGAVSAGWALLKLRDLVKDDDYCLLAVDKVPTSEKFPGHFCN